MPEVTTTPRTTTVSTSTEKATTPKTTTTTTTPRTTTTTVRTTTETPADAIVPVVDSEPLDNKPDNEVSAEEEPVAVLEEGDDDASAVDCTDKLFVAHKRCDRVSFSGP